MFSEKKVMVHITEYNETRNSAGDLVANFMSPKYDMTFENLRMDVKIEKLFGGYGNRATVDIYGVSKEKMEQITTIAVLTGFITSKRLRIYMDDGNGYSLRFEGFISYAAPVYNKAPDTYIKIESSSVAFPNAAKVPPFRTTGSATVAYILDKICSDYGVNADTKEVPFKVVPAVSFGQDSLSGRISAACRTYDLIPCYTGVGYKFYPKGGFSSITPYIMTPEDYNGFPSFNSTGLSIETDHLYDFQCGERVTIQGSDLSFANGTWVIHKITYNLQPLTQNGKWDIKLDLGRVLV